jgi:dTDP-4-dehydrorhamnose reductase
MNLTQPKALVIGASGQVGTQILHLMPADQYLITSRKPRSRTELPFDLATIKTRQEAEKVLTGHSLSAIYCIAGMTNVEACEDTPELAHNTNCRGPEILAQVANARSIPFVYFSTEYVFDGEHGPYSESDLSNPLSAYGRSKWDGERAILAACGDALILRTTVVYGADSAHKNYIYSVIRALAAGKTMRVPADQISTPTYNRDLARAALALVARQAAGIFHVCGPERMDRLTFARSVASYFSLDQSLLFGVPTGDLGQKAPRPLSAGLSIDKLHKMHPDLKMHILAESLDDCRRDLEHFFQSCDKLEPRHS